VENFNIKFYQKEIFIKEFLPF